MPAPRWANGCGCSAPTTIPPRRSDWRRSPRRVTPAKKMKITMSAVSSRAWNWSRAIVSARGTRSEDFTVLQTWPKGPVVIQPTTTIEVSRRGGGIEVLPQRIAYEDIGGLQRELGSIREMIELPLRYPEIFERLGIE